MHPFLEHIAASTGLGTTHGWANYRGHATIGASVAVNYDSDPLRFLGTGTVFVARDDGRVWGYWDGLPDTGPRPLEQLPEGMTLREAAAWGLERTKRVVVRTETTGYFIVGELSSASDLNVDLLGAVSLAEVDHLP